MAEEIIVPWDNLGFVRNAIPIYLCENVSVAYQLVEPFMPSPEGVISNNKENEVKQSYFHGGTLSFSTSNSSITLAKTKMKL